MLRVAKLRVTVRRLFRLGGCQLLDLSGYNMGYRLPNK